MFLMESPVRADPTSSPENWESDFDFDAPAGAFPMALFPQQSHGRGASVGGVKNDGPAGKKSAAGHTAISSTERRELEKLLGSLPELAFDDHLACSLLSGERQHDSRGASSLAGAANHPKSKLALKDLIRDVAVCANISGQLKDRIHAGVLARGSGSGRRGEKAGAGRGGAGKMSSKEKVQALKQELASAEGEQHMQRQVSVCLELARTYRSLGQTGAAMLQLQQALALMGEQHKMPDMHATHESCEGRESVTEAHILLEMASTARKIQDLNAAKGYLTRALWSMTSSTSLSPLWSPLWLELHAAIGSVMLALSEPKAALPHFSHYLSGVMAHQPPSATSVLRIPILKARSPRP